MKEEHKTEQNQGSNSVYKKQVKYAEALENFSQKEIPQVNKKKKHRWLSPLVLIIAIGVGVFLIIQMSQKMGDQKSFHEVFGSVLPVNLILVLGVLLAIIILDIAKFVIALQATTGKIHPLIGTKTSLLGRYYDNITPFAVGGQPMQIYYLHSKGFGGGLSSAVVLIKYFFNTIACVLVALISMACNTGALSDVPNGTAIAVVGWVGLAINMSLPLFILFFVIMPKFVQKLTGGLIGLGHKMKIVRNKEKAMKRALNTVKDFRSSFIIMAKSPVQLILLVFTCIAEASLTFAFPYFVIKMFNGIAPDQQTFSTVFSVMALNCYSIFGASIVPTPGSSGAIEGICTVAFSNIAGDTLLWVIFTWRFAVFYIYIIIGVAIMVFNFVRNIVRARRNGVVSVAAANAGATQTQTTNAAVTSNASEATSPKTTDTEVAQNKAANAAETSDKPVATAAQPTATAASETNRQTERIVDIQLSPPEDK